MVQTKYFYNSKTCNYEQIERSNWDIFFDLLGFFTVALVMAAGLFGVATYYFDSPEEARLKEENALLRQHYKELQKDLETSNHILAQLQDQDDNLYRMMLEAEPLPTSIRKAGIGGTPRHQELFKTNELISGTTEKVEQLKRQLHIQSKSYEEVIKLAKNKERMLACTPAIRPLSQKGFRYISSPFSLSRRHPVYGIPRPHEGIDLAAPRGTPIYATGNGVVKRAQSNWGDYGNGVEIEHGYGYKTRYGHMQAFIVRKGQKVTRGQCIGYVGKTGAATGPHLHYEVRKNNKAVNPIHYFTTDLSAAEYDMILELAVASSIQDAQ